MTSHYNVNQAGKPLNLLVFSGIFCNIRFIKLNLRKHEEALSDLRGIREERGLLSVLIFMMTERYEFGSIGTKWSCLLRNIYFFNRGINHDD